MMAANINDKVCSICLNEFNQPKLLACSHSFCYLCLDGYIQTSAKNNIFQCPLCRSDITVPEGGVNNFPNDLNMKDEQLTEDPNLQLTEDSNLQLIEDSNLQLTEDPNLQLTEDPNLQLTEDSNLQLIEDPILQCDEDDLPIDLGNLKSDNVAPNCEACKRNITSTFRCKDCNQCMCDSCKANHDMFRTTRHHFVAKLDETNLVKDEDVLYSDPRDFCPNHENKTVDAHCTRCFVSICSLCFIKDHNGHQFLDLQDREVKLKIREDLKSLTQDLENRIGKLQVFSESVSVKLSEIHDCGKEACKNVDSQVEKMSDYIKSQGDSLKLKINQTCNKEKLVLDKLMDEVQTLSDKLKSNVKTFLVTLEEQSLVHVLKSLREIKTDREIMSNRRFDIPNLKYPSFDESDIDKCVLSEQLGKMEILEESTYMSSFNLDDLIRAEYCFSKRHIINNLSWSTICAKILEKKSSGIFVRLEDRGVKYCHAKSTLKLLNTDDTKSVTMKDTEHKYIPNEGWGWTNLMDWKSFINPLNGFIDEENNFKIQTTIKILQTE